MHGQERADFKSTPMTMPGAVYMNRWKSTPLSKDTGADGLRIQHSPLHIQDEVQYETHALSLGLYGRVGTTANP